LKILYTVHQFFPEYTAGTEILTFHTAREMRRRGHETYVITGFPDRFRRRPSVAKESAIQEPPLKEPADTYAVDGISVYRYRRSPDPSTTARNPMRAEYDNAMAARWFSNRIRDIRPDIVHCYHLQRLSAKVVDVMKAETVPAVLTATDFWALCPVNQLLLPDAAICQGPETPPVNCLKHLVQLTQGTRATRRLSRFPDALLRGLLFASRRLPFRRWSSFSAAAALCDRGGYISKRLGYFTKVLTPTTFTAEVMARAGVLPDQIEPLPFGVDIPEGMGNRNIVSAGGLRIGFIGTLSPHKGAHMLLDAFGRLPKAAAVRLDIWGDVHAFPKYAADLREAAGGDPRVRFRGTFAHREIGRVLSEMDVLVFPSLWPENMPLTVLSAKAAGIPVVAARLSGIVETVVDGVDGLLYERDDVSGLARILERLITDRALMRRLSEQVQPPMSFSMYTDRLVEIYRRTLDIQSGR
jgi:glycosyltransferase involved in cell wall biosynthesis